MMRRSRSRTSTAIWRWASRWCARSSTARSQIAVPAFVSTLCICIVFVPVFFLSGTAKFLFEPLAMAVIFAMLASYFLSRTVVPTMVKFLLREHMDEVHHEGEHLKRQPGFLGMLNGFTSGSTAGFEKLRDAVHRGARLGARAPGGAVSGRWGHSQSSPPAWCRSWAAISSRRWMRGSSGCTCGRRRGRGSKRPQRALLPGGADHPAGGAARRKSTPCSRTSGCRSAASTSRLATTRPSGRPTGKSWSR